MPEDKQLVNGQTRILTVKLILQSSLPLTRKRAKTLQTWEGFGLPYERPQRVSLLYAHTEAIAKSRTRDQRASPDRLVVNSPPGILWGCAHTQATEEGLRKPESFSTQPRRQRMTLWAKAAEPENPGDLAASL